MAVRVVDLFEVVQVQHGDGEGVLGSPGPGHLLLHPGEERAAIRDAGERIGGGLYLQLLLEFQQVLMQLHDPLTGVDAHLEFVGVERLHDVVVGACFHPGH